jgi:hypothetical protein
MANNPGVVIGVAEPAVTSRVTGVVVAKLKV